MDVDNDSVDQTLLQQFSCLGTTDRDDLIKQLQKLVGDNINATTASFFLDMNNWNLQAAVCSYFDLESPFKLPSMGLIRDETEDLTKTLPPNIVFNKTWRIQNTGNESWPSGCCLQFSGGTAFQCVNRVPVPPLVPSSTTDVSVQMTSPSELGVYQNTWRMITPSGAYFGDAIWLIVTVVDEESTNQLTDQLQNFNPLGTVQQRNPFTAAPLLNFQDSVPSVQDNDNTMC